MGNLAFTAPHAWMRLLYRVVLSVARTACFTVRTCVINMTVVVWRTARCAKGVTTHLQYKNVPM